MAVGLALVAGIDYDAEIKQLLATMKTIGQVLDLDRMRTEIADLGEQVAAPDLWDDVESATRVTGRLSALQGELDRFTSLESRIEDLGLMVEMAQEEGDADTLADTETELSRIKKSVESLEIRTLLAGEYDEREAIVTIRSGAGGVDAADFAEMLMRMYTRWAERNNYAVEVFDTSYAEEAGLKSATFTAVGENAYGLFSAEKGVHRLVRISPFDSAARRHTAFAGIEVAPLVEDTVEIEIEPDDLQIDTYRASGAGGQHVNKTDSAVRITHRPSGIVVQCQNERSQTANKETAMKMLRGKLIEAEERRRAEEIAKERGEAQDVGWGSQIRSYVLHPYTMVKDHRTNVEIGNVQGVLDGNLDELVRAELLRRAGAANGAG